jgi:hypothetical protein
MQKCLSCGGVYEPVLPDGLDYYHKCAPLTATELAAAVQAGKLSLPIDPVTKVEETPDEAVQRRSYERANARDENVTPNGALKAVGAGVEQLAAPIPTVVKVP